jgi:type VI secretion system Hcp family effector
MPVDAFMRLSGSKAHVLGESFDHTHGGKKHALGAFEIFSFDWGVGLTGGDGSDTTPAPAAAPAGGTRQSQAAAKQPVAPKKDKYQAIANMDVELKPFTVTKEVDLATPDLFLACCKKAPFETAQITFRKAGQEEPVKYMVFHFTKVYVQSLDLKLAPGESSDKGGEETVTFLYGSCQITYHPQLESGSPGSPKIKGWDREKNVETAGDKDPT